MLEALEALKAAIVKQWGEIPVEIEKEIQILEDLINPPAQKEAPAPETPEG